MNAAQIALLALFDLAAVEFDGEGERTLIVDVQLFVVLRNQGADDRIGPVGETDVHRSLLDFERRTADGRYARRAGHHPGLVAVGTFQVAVFVCGNNGRLLLRIVVVEIEYDRIGVVGEFDIEVVAAAVNLEFALGEVLLIDVFGFVAFERRHFERLGHLLVIAVGSFDDRNDHISGIVVEVFEQNLLRRGGLHLVARGEDVVFCRAERNLRSS